MRGIEPISHSDIQQLLPWHTTGTLPTKEAEHVDRHLAGCEKCRAEAVRCRAEAEAIRATAITAPAPHPAGFARLSARIDEAEARRGSLRRLASALGERRWLRPGASPALRWAVAAQLLVISILVALLFSTRDAPAPTAQPRFHTLSTPSAPASATGSLRVVFTPESSSDAVRRLLLEIRAEIVAGPSPLGVYTLALRGESGPAEPLEVVLEHLREHPIVRFAERIDGGGQP